MVIRTVEEIEQLKEKIISNADTTYEQLKVRALDLSAIAFLAEVKFDKTGLDPLKGTELNFIEQLNQMFSDLVVLEGAEQLLRLNPGRELKLSFGPAPGFDIVSSDGEVVAECFAVTTATSNQKLQKDCSKLMCKAVGKQKHIFFYSRNDSEEKLHRIYDKYPEIRFTRITEFH